MMEEEPLSIWHVDTVIYSILSHLVYTITLQERYYYLHFADPEAEAEHIGPGVSAREWESWGLKLRHQIPEPRL